MRTRYRIDVTNAACEYAVNPGQVDTFKTNNFVLVREPEEPGPNHNGEDYIIDIAVEGDVYVMETIEALQRAIVMLIRELK